MDGTQFLILPWFQEKSGGGRVGNRIMKKTVYDMHSQFWKAKLRQPIGQRLSNVRKNKKKSIGQILFLHNEESLISVYLFLLHNVLFTLFRCILFISNWLITLKMNKNCLKKIEKVISKICFFKQKTSLTYNLHL